MKRFIDDNGLYEINIPITWKYELLNDKIHTFKDYEKWKPDTFQVSINKFDNEKQKADFLKKFKNHPKVVFKDVEFIQLPEITDRIFTTKGWFKIFTNEIVGFSYTYQIETDPDLDDRTIEQKLDTVHQILSTFQLIDLCDQISKLNTYRFEIFLQGIGATSALLNKAIGNKAFIEATCLFASQIDALLRIGIVLQLQINNNNIDIDTEWIYQGSNDRKKSEKDIYKKACDIGIISRHQLDDLYRLYDDRNRVVHRFIISEITLAEIEDISYDYYQKQQEINGIIKNIENEQIRLNIGITKIGENDACENNVNYIEGKIGKQDYFDKKKNS